MALPRWLREGFIAESALETVGESECLKVVCQRLTLDGTGSGTGTERLRLWLRQDTGTPVRGEIAVDGEIILTAEFTSFFLLDTGQPERAGGTRLLVNKCRMTT